MGEERMLVASWQLCRNIEALPPHGQLPTLQSSQRMPSHEGGCIISRYAVIQLSRAEENPGSRVENIEQLYNKRILVNEEATFSYAKTYEKSLEL